MAHLGIDVTASQVPAAGLSRRHFLRGSSMAAAAIMTPVAASTAVTLAPAAPALLASAIDAARDSEAPEMIQAGADLALAQQRHTDALAALVTAREAALQLAPVVPAGLPVAFGISIFGQTGWFTLPEPADILGNPVELPPVISRKGTSLKIRIPRASDIVRDRASARRLCGLHLPEWLKGEHRRLYDLAVQFERELDQAREASGLDDAEWELTLARFAIERAAEAANTLEAKTVLGLLIKAQAIAACQAIDSEAARGAAYRGCQTLARATCAVLEGAA